MQFSQKPVAKDMLKSFYVLKKDGRYFTGMGNRRGFFAHSVGMSYSLTSLAEIRHEQSILGGDVFEATPMSTDVVCKYAERLVPPEEMEAPAPSLDPTPVPVSAPRSTPAGRSPRP